MTPLSGANVAYSTLEGRPSGFNFEYSPELQVGVAHFDLDGWDHRVVKLEEGPFKFRLSFVVGNMVTKLNYAQFASPIKSLKT